MTDHVSAMSRPSSRGWQIGLWIAQILLAVAMLMPGVMKTFMAPEALQSMGIAWAGDVPIWFVRFIGICELAGGIGVILPALTRIAPFLTPLAAACFALVQVLAIGFHATRGETEQTIIANVLLLALALFVAWGRGKKLPIVPRG